MAGGNIEAARSGAQTFCTAYNNREGSCEGLSLMLFNTGIEELSNRTISEFQNFIN